MCPVAVLRCLQRHSAYLRQICALLQQGVSSRYSPYAASFGTVLLKEVAARAGVTRVVSASAVYAVTEIVDAPTGGGSVDDEGDVYTVAAV